MKDLLQQVDVRALDRRATGFAAALSDRPIQFRVSQHR